MSENLVVTSFEASQLRKELAALEDARSQLREEEQMFYKLYMASLEGSTQEADMEVKHDSVCKKLDLNTEARRSLEQRIADLESHYAERISQ